MKILFNVKGTHYLRTLRRRKGGSHYVIHNGKRFTVIHCAYYDRWNWASWCDSNTKELSNFFK